MSGAQLGDAGFVITTSGIDLVRPRAVLKPPLVPMSAPLVTGWGQSDPIHLVWQPLSGEYLGRG